MAKMKTFAVDVEIVVKRTIYVDARRPNGAIDRLYTEEGWREATRYAEEGDVIDTVSPPKDMTITRVREAGF